MICDLHCYFGELAAKLPLTGQRGLPFSAETFREVPEHLESDQLVVLKRHRDYGGSRADQLVFCADKATYQRLGLLILSVVFRPEVPRAHIALTSPSSDVKNLIVEYAGSTSRGSGYRTRPDRFLFHMEPVKTHPWTTENLDLFGLPEFVLTNMKEFVVTDEDRARRDTVKGFGNDDAASVKLADLLLKIGSPDNATNEVVLEGEGGFRGVGIHSAEAAFYLPGSSAWAAYERG